jgi:hypothetical protein
VACTSIAVEHCLASPRHRQTNSTVEHFKGRINELLKQTFFEGRAELEATLQNDLKLIPHYILQRAQNLALREWRRKRPNYSSNVHDLAGLVTHSMSGYTLSKMAWTFCAISLASIGGTALPT